MNATLEQLLAPVGAGVVTPNSAGMEAAKDRYFAFMDTPEFAELVKDNHPRHWDFVQMKAIIGTGINAAIRAHDLEAVDTYILTAIMIGYLFGNDDGTVIFQTGKGD